MSLGPLFFAAPWALLALAALPVLIWILRATPPPPVRAAFPPLRLLLDLRTEESQRHRAPWWLVLLRALLAALLILGFARPSWRPPAEPAAQAETLLLAIDDGWTSAPDWAGLRTAALAAIEEFERQGGRQVSLLTTAAQPAESAPLERTPPADARAAIARLRPVAWRPDRGEAARRLRDWPAGSARALWLSDGLSSPADAAFAQALQRVGPLSLRLPQRPPLALSGLEVTPEGVETVLRRSPGAPAAGAVAVETLEGRSLTAVEFRFAGGALETTALAPLPAEIAARAGRVRIVGEDSAGAVRLLSGGAGRPVTGLVAAAAGAQPLLSDLFYLERAMAPFAALKREELGALLQGQPQAIVLADTRLGPGEQEALQAWIEAGGLLIRFAGPRLADQADTLLPAPLRPGARALGGALAWETPQGLAPFAEDSPFAGLPEAPDVRVRQQVLVEPFSLGEARVWARLGDGTPIVTARASGQGLIVLFHVSAGPSWSDLPLSGLYVEMLRRTLAFAGRAAAAGEAVGAGPWVPEQLFDGFGVLGPARTRLTVPDETLAEGTPGPALPPGLYGREGSPQAVVSAARAQEPLAPLQPPPGALVTSGAEPRAVSLAGLLLGAAAVLAVLDMLLALALAGTLQLARRGGAAGAGLAALLWLAQPWGEAKAQVRLDFPPGWGFNAPDLSQDVQNPGDVRLAYIRTGDARQDRITRLGLEALSRTLLQRTAVEPGAVAEVDLARDDLSQYPLLYFAAPSQPRPLSPAAAANLDRFMQLGGMLLLDTRGQGGGQSEASAAATLLEGVNAPPLEPVSASTSVYGKAFYLLRQIPGRRRSVRLWAESAGAAASRDGVASLIVGDGDWAALWAEEDSTPFGARRRELALRFGVNLVMVALTGNYKADQVHIPELLRRLGEGRAQ